MLSVKSKHIDCGLVPLLTVARQGFGEGRGGGGDLESPGGLSICRKTRLE